ncbi:hypothetical protein RND81_14G049800 [Saponaria officinalis]|uniref:RRM domain-containing protein n=1 Tax=Saponaria officinalis TaxID=3572 RepID=A0AAW1GUF6_SAPOF
MALFNKLGSVVKQSISQNSTSSMFISVRYMSSKLFVGGLSYGIDDKSLREAFSGFGEVTDAKVIMDRNTGRSRGFGFVDYVDSESANSAVKSMDGHDLEGRNIHVSIANERPPGPRGGGYGGGGGSGGGGGYGGGDGY